MMLIENILLFKIALACFLFEIYLISIIKPLYKNIFFVLKFVPRNIFRFILFDFTCRNFLIEGNSEEIAFVEVCYGFTETFILFICPKWHTLDLSDFKV